MRQYRLWTFSPGILLLASLAVASAAEPLPSQPPSSESKCPVCGMFVSRFPDWVAQIRFKDHKTVFFDGAKDFFKYYFRITRYHPERSRFQVAAAYVTDYYTMRFINAAAAYFVVGSEVYGPMGHELIAFANPADAEAFMRDHRGRKVLRFEAVTKDMVDSLD